MITNVEAFLQSDQNFIDSASYWKEVVDRFGIDIKHYLNFLHNTIEDAFPANWTHILYDVPGKYVDLFIKDRLKYKSKGYLTTLSKVEYMACVGTLCQIANDYIDFTFEQSCVDTFEENCGSQGLVVDESLISDGNKSVWDKIISSN